MPLAVPLPFNSRRLLGWFGFVLLIGYWIGLECLTIRHGCDFRDTGRAATIAYQLANDDRPFVDCALSSVHLTEYYASWFLRWKPDATMLDLRIFSSVVQFIGIAAAYWLLLRTASPIHVTAALILSVAGVKAWFTWPLHYDKLAATLSVLSTMVLCLAIQRPTLRLPRQASSEAPPAKGLHVAWILAGFSGVLACLAGSARMPHLGMVALPMAAWLAARIVRADRLRWWPLAAAFWGGFAATIAVLLGWIVEAGYWESAVDRFQLFLTRRSYGSESTGYLTTAVCELGVIVAETGAFLGGVALVFAGIRRGWAWPLMGAAAMALVVGYYSYLDQTSWNHQRLVGLGVAGAALFALLKPTLGSEADANRLWFDRIFVAMAGLLLAGLATVGSNMGLRTAIHSGHLLLPLGVLALLELPARMRRVILSEAKDSGVILSEAKNLHRSEQKVLSSPSGSNPHPNPLPKREREQMLRFAQRDTRQWLAKATAWTMAGAVGAASLLFYLQNGMFLDQYSIRDASTYGEFKSGRMAGVRADAKRVALFEELIDCVKVQVRPNDFVLAYYDLALVYFATDTRPAIFDSWLMLDHPPEYEQAALEYMLAHDRIPKLVIRTRVVPNRHWPRLWRKSAYPPDTYDATDPAEHPINAWVEGHFTMDRCIGPFEVWRPSEGDGLQPVQQIAGGGLGEDAQERIPAGVGPR